MSLIPDSIPNWVWIVALVASAIPTYFSARKHRKTLLAAAQAPGATERDQAALANQTAGGIGMTALLAGVLSLYVFPEPYSWSIGLVGLAVCFGLVLWIRRTS